MKISSRFTVAVHTLLAIHILGNEYKTTSEFIASSVNVNPVVIRRTLLSLKAAGLVTVKAGSGGAALSRDIKDISLYDVYTAVDCIEGSLFHFHENPNADCPVGKNIHAILDTHLAAAQTAMENELKSVTLADLTEQLSSLI
ncbi:MAG: Rrf2 family transcriptional regulator [Butyrivibrio sp.]|nr:Rrf2 family transcriptional regulator [Butyrivibrio sp.]